ncbi:MAG TPA: hypothetical protein VF544_15655 [Pyrinomonadaceae bacterium]|jgi:plastocyanin
MAEQHKVVIKGNEFRPNTLHLHAGDTVVWENQDGHPHTATCIGTRFPFDTGIIQPNATSTPVLFGKPTQQSGLGYFCQLHDFMVGRLFVLPAEFEAQLDGAKSKAAFVEPPTYSVDVWKRIARIVAVHWVYDMSDNFAFAKRVQVGDALDRINTEWATIETWWQQQIGTNKTIIGSDGNLDPTAFESESRDNLEALGRRIRAANRRLLPTVFRYPAPIRPDDVLSFGELYEGQSDDPFGEAITVNFIPKPLQDAEVRHEAYAGALASIEITLDTGGQMSEAQKKLYKENREAMLPEDFLRLAGHQYFGLSKLFNSGDFQEEQFKAGIRRMTVRGEWDGSTFPMWHWMRWIDGYITVKETGQLPNPLGL